MELNACAPWSRLSAGHDGFRAGVSFVLRKTCPLESGHGRLEGRSTFAVWLLFTGCCMAQFETASVLGTVRDPSGAVIAGARITLRNIHTGISASGKTDPSGNYEFLTVKIGDYRVNADATGFTPLSTEPFNVAVNARQRVDLTMQVGTASETVTPSSHLASRDYQRALPGDGKSSHQERKGGLSAVLALMCQNVV